MRSKSRSKIRSKVRSKVSRKRYTKRHTRKRSKKKTKQKRSRKLQSGGGPLEWASDNPGWVIGGGIAAYLGIIALSALVGSGIGKKPQTPQETGRVEVSPEKLPQLLDVPVMDEKEFKRRQQQEGIDSLMRYLFPLPPEEAVVEEWNEELGRWVGGGQAVEAKEEETPPLGLAQVALQLEKKKARDALSGRFAGRPYRVITEDGCEVRMGQDMVSDKNGLLEKGTVITATREKILENNVKRLYFARTPPLEPAEGWISEKMVDGTVMAEPVEAGAL